MSIPSSPIVRRQRLGRELRKLRESRALKGKQVIAELGWRSQSKLSRIENGESRTDVADIMDLLDLYDVHGDQRDKLIAIAREAADRRALWRAVAGVGDRQRSYAELEAGATLIREYQQLLVPGLLQTPDYAKVRMESGRSLYEDLDHDADTQAREARKQILFKEKAPSYEAIVEEGALRRAVAPPEIMRGQLSALLTTQSMPNVSVRVLPDGSPIADFHVPHTAFLLYRFADPEDPALVILETLTSDVHIRDDEEIAAYEKVYGWIERAALSEGASHTLIRTLAEQL